MIKSFKNKPHLHWNNGRILSVNYKLLQWMKYDKYNNYSDTSYTKYLMLKLGLSKEDLDKFEKEMVDKENA